MTALGFLFNCDMQRPDEADASFKEEYEYLTNRDVRTFLFDMKTAFEKGKLSLKKSLYPIHLIYRGWMLSDQQYQKLYDLLLEKNFYLIVTPLQYQESHYLDKWYPMLKDITAKTYYSEGLPREEEIKEMLSKFGNQSIIVKDYVKTLNYEWYDSCFIDDASNIDEAFKVINNFIEKQGNNFSGGLVLREYLDIQKTGTHFDSGKAINEEVRIFCFENEPFCFISYWSGGTALRDKNFLALVDKCDVISSPFYTIDLAKLANGEWVLIDIGDGQVSQLRGYDVEKFYNCFLSVLNISYTVY